MTLNYAYWWFDNNKNSHWSISYCKSCYLKFIHTWHKNQWNWWSYREVVISFSPFIGRRSLANEGWWSSKKQKYNTEIGQTDSTSQKEMASNISELNTANLSTTVFLQGLMSVIVHPHWRNYTPLPHTAHLLMGSMVSLIVLFAGMANIWVIGCFIRWVPYF